MPKSTTGGVRATTFIVSLIIVVAASVILYALRTKGNGRIRFTLPGVDCSLETEDRKP
ncbi:MAG: hypothetical protein ACREMY_15035 [bacterium]